MVVDHHFACRRSCPDHMEYLDAAKDIWNYISTYLVDNRAGSEWYWALDKDRKPHEKIVSVGDAVEAIKSALN